MNQKNVLERLEHLETLFLHQKEVLNFEETCQFLSLKKSYVYKLTHKGTLPHYKPNGKNIYFNRKELESWLMSNKRLSQDEIESKATTFLTTKNLGGKKKC